MSANNSIGMSRWPASFNVLLVIAVGFFAGCGNDPASTENPDSTSNEPTAVRVDQKANRPVAAIATANQKSLVGTWLGTAYLDALALDKALQELPQQSRLELEMQARNFMSTVMAMDLQGDGSLVNAVEIQPVGGQTMQQESTGNWRVVQIEGQKIEIETMETFGDGSQEKAKRVCNLYDDGRHFSISVELPGKLAGCNPLIVFERQEMGPTTLAEAPSESQKK